MKVILFFVLCLITNIVFGQKVFILSSEENHVIIPHYIEKLPASYIVKGIVKSSNFLNTDYINEKIKEFDPQTIIFIGDSIIKYYLTKYYNDHKHRSLFYCCNFNIYNDVEISGVDFQINLEILEKIISKFDDIYILKSNDYDSETISNIVFSTIKSKPIVIQNISSIHELRKFFIKTSKNSLILNFISNLDNVYDKEYINNEIEVWNKKSIIVDFYNNGVISLIPNYNTISQLMAEYTLLNRHFRFQNVLNFELNYYNIPINKQNLYFEFDLNIFDIINMD